MIIGSEKPVYWTNHSGTEDRNRVVDSEPVAVTLTNGGEYPQAVTADETSEISR